MTIPISPGGAQNFFALVHHGYINLNRISEECIQNKSTYDPVKDITCLVAKGHTLLPGSFPDLISKRNSPFNESEKILMTLALYILTKCWLGINHVEISRLIFEKSDYQSFAKMFRFILVERTMFSEFPFREQVKGCIESMKEQRDSFLHQFISDEITRLLGERAAQEVSFNSDRWIPEVIRSLVGLNPADLTSLLEVFPNSPEDAVYFAAIETALKLGDIKPSCFSPKFLGTPHPIEVSYALNDKCFLFKESKYYNVKKLQVFKKMYECLLDWGKSHPESMLDLAPIEKLLESSLKDEDIRICWKLWMHLLSKDKKSVILLWSSILKNLEVYERLMLNLLNYQNIWTSIQGQFYRDICVLIKLPTCIVLKDEVIFASITLYPLINEISSPVGSYYELSQILAKKVSEIEDPEERKRLYHEVGILAENSLEGTSLTTLCATELYPSPFAWESICRSKGYKNTDELYDLFIEWEKGKEDLVDLNVIWEESYGYYEKTPTKPWYCFTRFLMLPELRRNDLLLLLISRGLEPWPRTDNKWIQHTKSYFHEFAIQLFTPEFIETLIEKWLNDPMRLKSEFVGSFRAFQFGMYHDGGNKHNFHDVLNSLLKIHPLKHLQIEGKTKLESLLEEESKGKIKKKKVKKMPFSKKEPFTCLGRTVIVGNRAFKIGPKIGEDKKKAKQEASVMKTFKTHQEEVGLVSDLPVFKKLYTIEKIPQSILEKISETGVKLAENGPYTILQYEAIPQYFIYLNDPSLSEKEFLSGLEKFAKDCAWMIYQGIYPITADLFHNIKEKRIYLTLINFWDETHSGAGRLDAFETAVKFPNGRASGTADSSDYDSESEVIKQACPMHHIRNLASIPEKERRWKCRAEQLGKLALVCTLLAFIRLEKTVEKLNWQSEDQQNRLSEYLKKASLWILSSYARKQNRNYPAIVEVLCNWEQRARQIIFWSQNDSEGYLGALNKHGHEESLVCKKENIEQFKKIPDGIYDPDLTIDIKTKEIKNFDPQSGLKADKVNRDWGGFNGPLPLIEEEKSWYILAALALTSAETKTP
jgi:hypothetical protein